MLARGFQYLTEARMDELEPALDMIRRDLVKLGLPLRSQEVEFGPSQCEFTFAPLKGVAAADTMVLFKSAVKQSARRNGLHATFMCRPQLPKHLFQRLAFPSMPDRQGDGHQRLHGLGRWRDLV